MNVPVETSLKRRAVIALLLLVPAPSVGTAASMFWWPELALGKAVFAVFKLWLVLRSRTAIAKSV